MTTIVASSAKLKVKLDLSANLAELKALEDQKARLDEGLKADRQMLRDSERGRERQAGEANQQARAGGIQVGGVRFSPLNPLDTALSLIGAIPQVGPVIEKSARVAMDLSEGALPLVTGFARGALKGMPMGALAAEQLENVLKIVGELSGTVAELKARNDALAPAFEAMKMMVRAQTLAGGTPNGKELGEFGLAMWKIIEKRSELDRKVRRLGLEAVGEGAERLFEGMFK